MPTTPTPSSCVLLLHLHEPHYCAFAATQVDKQKAAWLPFWPHTTDNHDDLNVTTTGVQKQISGCDLPMGRSNSLSSFIHSKGSSCASFFIHSIVLFIPKDPVPLSSSIHPIILSFQRMILLRLFLHPFVCSFFHFKGSSCASFFYTFVHSKRSRASFVIHSFTPSIFHSKGSCASSFFIHSFILSFLRILCLLFLHSFIHSFIPKDPVPPLSSFIPSFFQSLLPSFLSIHLFSETQLVWNNFYCFEFYFGFYGIIEFVWHFIHAMFNTCKLWFGNFVPCMPLRM